MEKRQIIIIGIIVVFGLGSYLAILIMASNMESNTCGQYRDQLQKRYYSECLDSGKTAQICDGEAGEKSWDAIQGVQEEECVTLLDTF